MDETNKLLAPPIPFTDFNSVNFGYAHGMTTVLFFTHAVFGIKASKAKKLVNAVWGKKGLDPKNTKVYFICKISNEKKYNGFYAYSLALNTYKKLKV